MAGAGPAPGERVPPSADELRRQAEARVDSLSAAAAAHEPHAPEEVAAIVHELRVHQIELEMQNEELRGAQLKLAEQREKYFELFDHAPVGYMTLTAKGLVADANRTATRLLGVERPLLVGQPFTAFILAADRDEYYLHRRRLANSDEPQTCEVRLQRLAGATGAEPAHFWARLEERRQDTDGRPGAYWVTFADIGAQKEAERARSEAKDLLDRVGAISHAGGWQYDVASGRVAWTDEMYRIYGVDQDFDTNDAERIIGLCSPESRPVLAEAVRRAVEHGEPYDLDVEVELPDGSRRWVHGSGRAILEDGAVVSVVGTAMDVTERREAELLVRRTQAMRDTAESIAHVGSVRWDLATGKAEWSPEMHRLFALSPEEFDGDSSVVLETRFHPDDRVRAEKGMARARQTGVTSPTDYRVVWPDGSEHILHGEGTTEYAPDGTPVAITGYYRDVTEERRAALALAHFNDALEEQVFRRTAQLEAANGELEAFVYSASHDLRAPLRAIDGFSQMVVEDAGDRLDADDMEHLQRVRAAARRMALLIDHLLSLSRTARKELLLETTDLSALATSVLAELREAQRGRRVTTVVEPGLVVDADSALLHVILTNLLANAWKFTSRHETARIEVGTTGGPDERVYFVKDDGVGFDPVQAEHLFGAFQRFHAAEEFEGDGVGLATVQRLVAKHGGRVWAEAEVGKGATFFFTLPPSPDA